MATGVRHGLAGAVVSPSLKPSGETPLFFLTETRAKLASWQIFLCKIRSQELSRTIILILHLLFVTVLPVWGSWHAARLQPSSGDGLLSKPTALHPPFNSWSQFTVYSTILNNGRASPECHKPDRNDRCGGSVGRFATVLCTFLLLCGDIHLNPGPGEYGLQQGDRSLTILGSPGQLPGESDQFGDTRVLHERALFPEILHPSGSERSDAPQGNNGVDSTHALQTFSINYPSSRRKNDAAITERQADINATVQTSSSINTTTCDKRIATRKQQTYKLFQTVNHAKVLWDSNVKPKGIFGGHLNIRSIVSKTEQLEHLLSDSNHDYLCLSETWLTPTTPSSVFSIPGYNVFRQDRKKGKGGGVMIYVKEGIQCNKMDLPCEDLECVGISIILSPEMSYNVIVLYRPPNAKDVFFNNLSGVLKKCDGKEVVLMGDFNLNWLDKTRRKKLKDITTKFQLTQMIEKPTRITKSSKTILDLIFTNRVDRIIKTYNLITGLSDHNLTLASRQLSKMRYKYQLGKKHVSLIPKKDIEHFENDVKKTKWESLVNNKNCEQACVDFISTFKALLSTYTKTMFVKQSKKQTLPWFNDALWHVMKTRDAALKKSLKSGLETDSLIFKSLRNKVIGQLRKAKANFFLEIIKQAKGNSKLLWKGIDQLSGKAPSNSAPLELKLNGNIHTDRLAVANGFNDYFLNSVIELGGKFSEVQLPVFTTNEANAMYFKNVDEAKVNKILSLLSNSKAKDIWGVDTVCLKKHKNVLTSSITKIINLSLNENVFPSTLKTAIVTPVYKSGDRQEVSNYRPISILPAISKVVEKAVAEQLVAHLNKENLLHPMQFGFRANHSTETACCYFLEVIKSSLDKGGVVGALFLDLRKAFDTVNHSVLLSKLSSFKLSVDVLNWIQSYLVDRSQCVRIDDKTSPLKACGLGVPQGSILGPLLFSAYINDLPSVCDEVGTLMYADDTVLYTSGKDPEQVAAKLSLAMEKVTQWLQYSRLTLNTDKTVTMFFSNKQRKMALPNIYVNGQLIKNVNEFKYLGVTLDSTLTFKSHIKKMSQKLKYNLLNFKHIRNSLTVEASKTYFNAMILAYCHYCMSCWSQASTSVLKPIRSLHKQALKILDRKSRQYHHCGILNKYKMLSFDTLMLYSDVRLVYKIIHNAAPPPLENFVALRSEHTARASRSVSNGDCNIPKRSSAFGQSAFSFKATKSWNRLPTNLKLCTDFNVFSHEVKQWILRNQTCQHYS